MILDNEKIFQMCQDMQKEAIGKISVGAVCHGQKRIDGKLEHAYFAGANLHISDSFADIHAEQSAVNQALLKRYYPTEIFVTSQNTKECVRLCGSCRQYLNEINNKMSILVFNPDGTIKSTDPLYSIYPYAKETSSKNMELKSLCSLHTAKSKGLQTNAL